MDLHRLLRSLTLLVFLLATYFSSAPARHHATRHRHGHGEHGGGGRHKRQHRPRAGASATAANVTYLPGSYVVLDGAGTPDAGDWGPWSEPSECSRSCGGGVAFQTRDCHSGTCSGGRKRYFSCNIQDCPESSMDFREEQCAAFNNIAFEGRYYQWVPYTKAPNKCELNCMPQGDRFYFRHKETVEDGTRCDEEKLDICVEGQCLPVGCDMMLGSSAKEDKCRECRGDGSSCRTIQSVLEMDDLKVGYNDILLIPAGATNIRVEEVKASNNYLAIRNVSNHYYLNGNWRIDIPRSLKIAGTVFHYERKPYAFLAPETITALGPTIEPLYIVFLVQEPNPGVSYEYSIHKGTQQTDPDSYAWIYDDFSDCSATCGGGFKTRNVTCVRRKDLELQPSHLCNPILEPKRNESCNTDPCPPVWAEGEWGECSQTCGEGGTQTRQVHCEQIVSSGVPSIVDDEKCLDLYGPKPSTTKECGPLEACPLWHTGPWKPCDHLCGDGKQKRKVRCYRKVDGKIEVLADTACSGEKPEEEKPCTLRPCEGVDWVFSDWSECEGKCGLTYKTRKVYCANEAGKIYPDEFCHSKTLPETKMHCETFVPCEHEWFASQWSECSAECGTGIKTRKVFCGSFAEDVVKKVEDDKCDPSKKYEAQRNCTGQDECPGQWHYGPWSSCSKKCGGGSMSRKVFCLIDSHKVEDSKCDPSLFPFLSTSCNNNACSGDEMMPVEPTRTIDDDEYDEYDCDTSTVVVDTTLAKGSAATESSVVEGSGDDISLSPLMDAFTSELSSDSVSGSPGSSSGSDILSTASVVEDTDITSKAASEFSFGTSDDIMLSDETRYFSDSPSTTLFTAEGSGDTVAEETTEFEDLSTTPTQSTLSRDITSSSESDSSSDETTKETGTTISAESTTDAETTIDNESHITTESTLFASIMSTVASVFTESLGASSSTESGTSDETDGIVTSDFSESSEVSTSTQSTPEITTSTSETDKTDTSVDITRTTNLPETDSTAAEDSDDDDIPESGRIPHVTELPKDIVTTKEPESEETTESSETDILTHTTPEGVTEESASNETVSSSVSTITEALSESSPDSTTALSTEPSTELSTESSIEQSTKLLTESSTESSTDSETTLSSDVTLEGTEHSTKTSEVVTELSFVSETTSATEISGSTLETVTDESSVGYSTPMEIFVTTPSPAQVAITKEQKIKKCRRKKKPKEKKSTCKTSEFGCCPDGVSSATGPFSKGCVQAETCNETKYKCCSDGVSAATGPKGEGCPPSVCEQTLFGCCPDGVSIAEGNDYEGCKDDIPFDCKQTDFGCCPDNLTPAEGPNYKGCFECEGSGECQYCNDTKYGCCPDGLSAAKGHDFFGCDEGSGLGTTEPFDCSDSEYGCCPDELNKATGPNYEGCGVINKDNCSASYFGCCKDSETAALGPNSEGCPISPCDLEPYGCCDDNKTPAHGPNKEGCCLNSPHGCCPDNILAANGPNLEGCGCQYALYGCCPDNTTAARGANAEGCGCRFTEYGCCPNQYTPAAGANFEGCPCHTHQFGCCPDGITIARGPRNHGCGCENKEFGCCSDGKTPSEGPEEAGCDCAASKYGCCIDGITSAQGEKFESCEDAPVAPADACTQLKERGPCRDFTVKWFFDTEYGGCARFWYGGCGGTDNRFKTQDDCKMTCVEPPGRDACYLPKIEGPCEGYYPTWYYDNERKQCGQFIYGGCLGNNNKFETREECEELCVKPDIIDACEQPKMEGPCQGNFSRWYYDQDTMTCQRFIYGGCKGNANNFITESSCHQQCLKPGRSRDYCSLPRAQGNCTEHLPRWYFDASEQRCMPFYYSGCDGNANRFEIQEACERDCPPTIEKDICLLPAVTGSCHNYTERWYYNAYDVRCTPFYYGGCDGNENNFLTLQACQQRCESVQTPPPEEEFRREFCFLPEDHGPCSDSKAQWYYDRQDGVCKQFLYGGCHGNRNRFDSLNECERRCGNAQDICQLPRVVGPCNGNFRQWFYDQTTEECLEFDYGGCQGNGNRFDDKRECENYCKRTPPKPDIDFILSTQAPSVNEIAPADICSVPVDQGPCRGAYTNWYFNEAKRQCEAFIYGGCEGNANRFESEEQCERQCGTFKGQDVCNIPYDVGPCESGYQKWYFDHDSRRCQTFVYGGCHGNGNRFSSIGECESVCFRREEILPTGNDTTQTNKAICRLPVDSGPCPRGHYKRWYFDEDRRTCIPFIYTGCGGNLNRFKNFQYCLSFCSVLIQENAITESSYGEVPDLCVVTTDRCKQLRCAYGVTKSVDTNTCEVCDCYEPCDGVTCPEGTNCAVDLFHDPSSGETAFRPVCRYVNKEGSCPEQVSLPGNCSDECKSDADCSEDFKCCFNGCGSSCVSPAVTIVTAQPHRPSEGEPPYIQESEPIVKAEEGSHVTLKCDAFGNPPPSVLWRKGSVQIDSSGSRHKLLDDGSLHIINLFRQDAGTYVCTANNGVGQPTHKEILLEVTDPTNHPAEIIGEESKIIIASLGAPTTLHCYAVGWPRPLITWWRGDRMLPLSSQVYEQERDFSLLIRSVTLRNLGPFTCQAYNGLGRAASWTVTVKAVGPVYTIDPQDTAYTKYLISPLIPRTPSPFRPIHPPKQTEPPLETEPPKTFRVPVEVNITSTTTQYPIGSEISIPCDVAGFPLPRVQWYKENTPIAPNGKIQITESHRLIISQANSNDAGLYRCEAINEYESSSSSITIIVEGVFIHPNCTDNPFFANCKLIVAAKYCTHKYYARFCCKSCTQAGQLPSHGPHLEPAGVHSRLSFRRK